MQKNWTLTGKEKSVSENFSSLSSVGLVLTLMKRIMKKMVEVYILYIFQVMNMPKHCCCQKKNV